MSQVVMNGCGERELTRCLFIDEWSDAALDYLLEQHADHSCVAVKN